MQSTRVKLPTPFCVDCPCRSVGVGDAGRDGGTGNESAQHPATAEAETAEAETGGEEWSGIPLQGNLVANTGFVTGIADNIGMVNLPGSTIGYADVDLLTPSSGVGLDYVVQPVCASAAGGAEESAESDAPVMVWVERSGQGGSVEASDDGGEEGALASAAMPVRAYIII